MTLAPSPQGAKPVPLDLGLEALHAPHVSGDAVVVVMPLNHPLEPGSLLGDRVMTSALQAGFDRLKLSAHPFGYSPSLNRELLILEASATDMRQPQEFKRLWLARKTTELNQTCFDRVKGEAEGAEALVQLLHISPRLLLELESQYHIISIAGDDDIARCPLLPPCLTPKVKDVMQIKI